MPVGFLDQWLICGPFFSDRGWATLDEDYLFGEANVRPKEYSWTFGKQWTRFETKDHFLQFLFAPFQHTLFVTGYAHTYLHSPRAMDALLLMGSDDGVKAWLNGREVLLHDVNRAAIPGDDRAHIHLDKGWNSLLVKVRQGMAHWQFIAQIVGEDGQEVANLTSALEADCPLPPRLESAVGIRPRFTSETYGLTDSFFVREVQFEVGNTGSKPLVDAALAIEGLDLVPIDPLEPGRTRVFKVGIPLEAVARVMRGQINIRSDNEAPQVVVVLSEPSRLLRDLFAPFFIPDSRQVRIPALLEEFGWRKFAEDTQGVYMLIDPPGLRHYLSGLVGRFPMNDADSQMARQICSKLLTLALTGKADEFKHTLSGVKLPPLVAA